MSTVELFPEQKVRYPGRRRQWYLRLVADNGEVLATSEGYYSRWNAKRAAKKNFPGVQVREVAE